MALSKESIEATEFAKSQLINSNLDENCKKQLHNLLTISMMATNGISVDEKIQKITECINGIAILQLTFLDSVDKKIAAANKEQCTKCKAMQHALDVEEEEANQEIIDTWLKTNGINKDKLNSTSTIQADDSWSTYIKQLMLKPYIWIVLGLCVIMPNGIDLVKILIDAFGK